ncbi:MAG: hypothetical protein ABIL44_07845 [candidate division WOR-3 bacterium]
MNITFAQPDDWLGLIGAGATFPRDSDDVFVYTYGLNIRVSIGTCPIRPVLFLRNENNKETVIIGGLRTGPVTIGGGVALEKELTNYRIHIDYELSLPWRIPYVGWRIVPAYEYIDYKDSNIRQKNLLMIQLLAD